MEAIYEQRARQIPQLLRLEGLSWNKSEDLLGFCSGSGGSARVIRYVRSGCEDDYSMTVMAEVDIEAIRLQNETCMKLGLR